MTVVLMAPKWNVKGMLTANLDIITICINGSKVECKVLWMLRQKSQHKVLMAPKWNVKVAVRRAVMTGLSY